MLQADHLLSARPRALRSPVAVVTGASSGIGAGLARMLGARGYGLLLVSNDQPALETTASDLCRSGASVDYLQADLSAPNGCIAVARRCRNLDVEMLVNNVGCGLDGPFLSQPLLQLDKMMQLNMGAMIALTRLLSPRMLDRRRGTIINVASVAGFQASPNLAVYGATKAFVANFTESLRAEMRGTGVRVVLMVPGITNGTRFFDNLRHNPIPARPSLAIPVEQAVAEAMAGLDAGRETIVTGRRNRLRLAAQQLSLRWIGQQIAGMLRGLQIIR